MRLGQLAEPHQIAPPATSFSLLGIALNGKHFLRHAKQFVLMILRTHLGVLTVIRFIYTILAYLLANAVGLIISVALLDGFSVGPAAFVVAVLIFSAVQGVLGPLVTKISMKNFPQLMGGISLVTIFLGLWITSLLVDDMLIGGLANWLGATLLVWIGSLLAGILLPIYVFKTLRDADN